jgi:mono/diheme cytochrome c family protein
MDSALGASAAARLNAGGTTNSPSNIMNRVCVALFNNRAAAEPIRQRLLQAGIPAEVHEELGLARLWFVSKHSAGVGVEVPGWLAETAHQLLLTWDSAVGALGGAIRCPECKSLRVDYPQVTRKSISTNLVIGLLAGLGLVEKDYYCEDCHCMWPKLRATPSPNRCHRRKPGRIILSLAVCLGGVLRVFGDIPGPGGYANPIFSADAGAKAEMKSSVAAGNQGSAHAESPTYLRDVLPIVIGKCARCHGDETSVLPNWLDYKTAFGDRVEMKRRVWDSWKGSYYKQSMPAGNGAEAVATTEAERAIIRDWVANGAPRGVLPTNSGLLSKAERIEAGRKLFGTICAACHQPNGYGIPSRFPPLAGSDFLNADKHRAIKVVVIGLQGEVIVNSQKFNNSMPKVPLSDQDIANVLTFVYDAFGNSGKEVSAQEVTAVRNEKDEIAADKQNRNVTFQKQSPFE